VKILSLRSAFLISLGGTLGSLYFSEILKYPPCVLCWYQRICLYPLVLIFGIALWSEDANYKRYAEGISCSSKQWELFGFVTIPLLSLIGFLMICGLMTINLKKGLVGEK
jgi:disulfide bond formation protein DsbB